MNCVSSLVRLLHFAFNLPKSFMLCLLAHARVSVCVCMCMCVCVCVCTFAANGASLVLWCVGGFSGCAFSQAHIASGAGPIVPAV